MVRRPAGTKPELAPQPGLGDLAALAGQVLRAGTPVELRVTGTVRPLPGGIELSAYRIIQEALTNTMKHAGPGAAAAVRVHYAGSELTVEVTDDGEKTIYPERAVVPPVRDPVTAPGGHGLAGMRARVAMLGGELAAGPRDGPGFRVHARLPLRVLGPP